MLAVEARERAIDRSQYASVRERVKKACQSWKTPLVGLAAIALYNTAGVVILVLNDGIISGSTISLAVWPEGAVSNTMRS